MTVSFDLGIPVDFPAMMAWKVMTGGYAGGSLGDSLTAGNGSGAYVLENVQTSDAAAAQAQLLEVLGGGRRIANIIVSDRPSEPFTVTDGVLDANFMTLAGAGAKDTTNSFFTRFSRNPHKIDLPVMGIALVQKYYSPSETGATTFIYLTTVYPRCTVEALYGGAEQRNNVATSYRITPNYSDKDYTGEAFSASTKQMNDGGLTDSYHIISDHPLHIYTFMASGTTAQNITLTYTPVSSVVTINATPNESYTNGAAQALTSVTPGTKVAVTPTGADEDLYVITYQHTGY